MARKLIFFLATTLLMLCSCNRTSDPCYGNDVGDSVYVAQQIESTLNPSFTSVEDVQTFYLHLTDEYSVDEEFRNLSKEVLNNVATVCLRQAPSITKRDIVAEYRANKAVYDNLPTAQQPDSTLHPQVTSPPQSTSTSEVSYRYETDTVNGKPVRILIKEERTYE